MGKLMQGRERESTMNSNQYWMIARPEQQHRQGCAAFVESGANHD